jgi:hypothetical protein
VPSFACVRLSDCSRSAWLVALLVESALALALGALIPRARARANSEREVVLAGDSCPSAEAVRSMLAPLVKEEILLPSERVTNSVPATHVRVRDLGVDYEIELTDARRSQKDPARDCQERARVAAVFIALNLNAPLAAEAPVPATPSAPAPQPAPAPEAPAVDQRAGEADARSSALHIELSASVSVMFAPGRDLVAPAGGAALSLGLGAFRLTLSGALMGKVALPLSPGDPGGHVELLRAPLGASVGYVWRASRFALEPRLGLALDLLRVQGRELHEAARELRANAGVSAGLLGRVLLGHQLALFAGVDGAWFPYSYEVRVEPAPRTAHTPSVWLAGQLGLLLMLR